jgi:hypothetical protein
MKNHIFLVAALFCFMFGSINAQDKTVKVALASNTEQTKIESLLNSKNFEFIANEVLPLGSAPKDLVGSDYSVSFKPEMVISYMPFYGRSYSAMATMGKDKGMRFEGVPENFSVEKNKNGFFVNTKVTVERDTFSISMTVSNSGYATLTINSNNRGTISYQGEVVRITE